MDANLCKFSQIENNNNDQDDDDNNKLTQTIADLFAQTLPAIITADGGVC